MKKLISFGLLLLAVTMQAQTARKFTLNLTDDGKAQMVCFLPQNPSGKAIVAVPGGGYSMLSNTHEGYLASDWLNQQKSKYSSYWYRQDQRTDDVPYDTVGNGGIEWSHITFRTFRSFGAPQYRSFFTDESGGSFFCSLPRRMAEMSGNSRSRSKA